MATSSLSDQREAEVGSSRKVLGHAHLKEATTPVNRNANRVSRVLATTIVATVGIAIIAYLVAVVIGKITDTRRLTGAEMGTLIGVTLFLVVLVYPRCLDRLNLLRLPGGIQLQLEKIEKEQVEQREELEVFFSVLANILSLPAKFHLRALARAEFGPIEDYEGSAGLREEMFRLKRYMLIAEVPGQKIGDMFDGAFFRLRDFVFLTERGKRFIAALDKLEAN